MTFTSRWVELPDHVTELPGGLPQGFRATGVACGLKPSGARDLGLLVSDSPSTVSAARFTRSGVLAAPVLLTQERCRPAGIRAVVANAGNANAATGRRGLEDAARMQRAGAAAAGVPEDCVAVASTGVIGVPLDIDKVIGGIADAQRELAPDGDAAFAEAIRTTDAIDKHAALEVRLPSGTVRLCAQAKGAGMISPSFATMLCFVETDAALEAEAADLLLGVCVKRSFDRISVDGQLSTNDTAILMASGAAGVRIEPESEDELRFGEALDYLLRRLAVQMVRDGEGADRVGRVVVHGGHEETVVRAARAVADSPLVKAALNGGDPNWGRIAQAVGAALHDSAPLADRHLDRGRPGLPRRRGHAVRRGGARRGGRGRGGRVRRRPAGRGRGGGGALLRPLARLCAGQRGVHHLMRDIGTLLEALPYIREFHGRTIVIKYGGAAMNDPALREDFARDVVLLKYVGMNPIVVHGGGPEITAYMKRLDLPVEFVGGLRVSDEATVEVAKMVLVGKVNKDIVLRINRHGQPAVGLCGDDGLLFRVDTMEGPGGEDIGYVGRIERVNAGVIEHIAADYIPVIASIGADRVGRSHNVNADEAAAAVARALGAYKLMFLTDVPGWLRDPGNPSSVISECGADDVEAALVGTSGGMRPKLRACLDAIHGGVSYAHIVDGRVQHSLLLELFTDAGQGTKIRPAS